LLTVNKIERAEEFFMKSVMKEQVINEKRYLEKTKILDFNHPTIEQLVLNRRWDGLSDYHKIGAAYHFVKDEILFGYNESDDLTASQVLKEGYGQCNTKATLFMALLRRLNIACRFHGFTIDKPLQKGVIPAYILLLTPQKIIHSWVEVLYNDEWVNLEGFIIDPELLSVVQAKHSDIKGCFSGYGVSTKNLANPQVDWQGKSTYIQREGIHDDFGVYDSPDEFFQEKGTNLKGIRRLMYGFVVRHLINLNVKFKRSQFRSHVIASTTTT